MRRTPRWWFLRLEALAALAFLRVAVRVLPFRAVRWMVEGGAPAAGALPPADPDVRHAVDAVAARWSGPTCLDRSLARAWMLRRRGRPVRLQLGVRRDGVDALEAHAWVDDGSGPVDDAPEGRPYVPVTEL